MAPALGHGDHPVERNCTIKTLGGCGLQRVHPPHAEAQDGDVTHVVVDHEIVGGPLEVSELLGIIELRDVRHPAVDVTQVDTRSQPASERFRTDHGRAVGGEPATQIIEERPVPADVRMHDDAALRHAIGTSMKRRDEVAAFAADDDGFSLDVVASFDQRSHRRTVAPPTRAAR